MKKKDESSSDSDDNVPQTPDGQADGQFDGIEEEEEGCVMQEGENDDFYQNKPKADVIKSQETIGNTSGKRPSDGTNLTGNTKSSGQRLSKPSMYSGITRPRRSTEKRTSKISISTGGTTCVDIDLTPDEQDLINNKYFTSCKPELCNSKKPPRAHHCSQC